MGFRIAGNIFSRDLYVSVFPILRGCPVAVSSWAFSFERSVAIGLRCFPPDTPASPSIRRLFRGGLLEALFVRSLLFLRTRSESSIFVRGWRGCCFCRSVRLLWLLVCQIFVFRAVFGCVVALFRFLRRRISLLGAHKLDRFQP